MAFYTYILTNLPRRTVLYTGHTEDLATRMEDHATATSGFVAKYNCRHLVWFEVHEDRQEALAREYAIKRWRRDWKITLIEGFNTDWDDMSEKVPLW